MLARAPVGSASATTTPRSWSPLARREKSSTFVKGCDVGRKEPGEHQQSKWARGERFYVHSRTKHFQWIKEAATKGAPSYKSRCDTCGKEHMFRREGHQPAFDVVDVHRECAMMALNRFGDGGHPVASFSSLSYFHKPYVLKCLDRALASGALNEEGTAAFRDARGYYARKETAM